MELSVIKIGNSKGIILSRMILDKYQISNKIELTLEKGYIILKAKAEPRKNWELEFHKMHENGDDKLLLDDVFENENFEEWSK